MEYPTSSLSDYATPRTYFEQASYSPTGPLRPYLVCAVPGAIIAVVDAAILDQTETPAVSSLAEHPLLLSVSTTKSPS
jgi:hypothetical protein